MCSLPQSISVRFFKRIPAERIIIGCFPAKQNACARVCSRNDGARVYLNKSGWFLSLNDGGLMDLVDRCSAPRDHFLGCGLALFMHIVCCNVDTLDVSELDFPQSENPSNPSGTLLGTF